MRVSLRRIAVAVAVAIAVVLMSFSAANAAVSLTRSSGTVQQGGRVDVGVRATTASTSCVRVVDPSPGPGITASLGSNACGDSDRTVNLAITTNGDTPAGTYNVTVDDNESSATFRLTVNTSPAPTTTAAPTTTVPRTTTTAGPAPTTTTTVAPTTTTTAEPATTTTTAAPTTTTAPVTGSPGDFVAVSRLIAAGLPKDGVFFPLLGKAFRDCLPLAAPCADPDYGLVLVPARAADVTWAAPAEGVPPPEQLTGVPVPTVGPVGQPPADAATQSYLLPLLDESAGGTVKAVTRTLGVAGFAPAARLGTGLLPAVSGVSIEGVSKAFVVSQPFGRPYRQSASQFTQASPALALFSGGSAHLLYALVTDPAWNLGGDVLPLLGNGYVPYLAQAADGPAGLYLALPDGMTAPAAPKAAAAAAEKKLSGKSSTLFAIGIALFVVLAAAIAVLLWRRRRRATAADRERIRLLRYGPSGRK